MPGRPPPDPTSPTRDPAGNSGAAALRPDEAPLLAVFGEVQREAARQLDAVAEQRRRLGGLGLELGAHAFRTTVWRSARSPYDSDT